MAINTKDSSLTEKGKKEAEATNKKIKQFFADNLPDASGMKTEAEVPTVSTLNTEELSDTSLVDTTTTVVSAEEVADYVDSTSELIDQSILNDDLSNFIDGVV